MLTLSDLRRSYQPQIPQLLRDPASVEFEAVGNIKVLDEIASLFPLTSSTTVLQGKKNASHQVRPLKVGVVFSGGPAPGGHNVVAGLFDTLKNSTLFGFLGGPEALVSGAYKELKATEIDHFRNQGGFDLLGSGRTKIETPEQFKAALETLKKLKLDGLVIIGGDDSNTNAALLAEHFKKENVPTRVIGVPKTIDGDIQNPYVPISFGFDTAAKTYSEMIGNLAYDTLSSLKYFHFVKLMGRSASHLTLECALKTEPNITLISEEKIPLPAIITLLADWVEERSAKKRPYGIVLVPEGLLEKISLQTQHLPARIQKQLQLEQDAHGNINLSAIETELLLMEAVEQELTKRGFKGSFQPQAHFYGYEGRCGHPSNFDANYSYALGCTAALLLQHGQSSMMAYVGDLQKPPSDWTVGGVPLTALLKLEERKGKVKPVIEKALVDLQGRPFKCFLEKRQAWMEHHSYQNPGPIQFQGDPRITDSIPKILQ